jgi:hypothetical protein
VTRRSEESSIYKLKIGSKIKILSENFLKKYIQYIELNRGREVA